MPLGISNQPTRIWSARSGLRLRGGRIGDCGQFGLPNIVDDLASASLAVIAGDRRARLARARAADVAAGTSVVVGAGRGIVEVDTAADWVAGVVGFLRALSPHADTNS